jgi:hypothetical protein
LLSFHDIRIRLSLLFIGIAAGFVRQLPKTSSKQFRILPEQKKWTGWELNPRPKPFFLNHDYLSFKSHPLQSFSFCMFYTLTDERSFEKKLAKALKRKRYWQVLI